jgi:hypothetical protein
MKIVHSTKDNVAIFKKTVILFLNKISSKCELSQTEEQREIAQETLTEGEEGSIRLTSSLSLLVL